jgi:nucleoside-diphosphate-sugar epimerase
MSGEAGRERADGSSGVPGGASAALSVAVTGAFSYSGAAIADELLRRGNRVRTLTGHPGRAPGEGGIEVAPLDFTDPAGLRRSLTGVEVLYNTYWVRYPHPGTPFDAAVDHSRLLFEAAADAGVRRIVHLSITNPDPDSPYPYFRGKALVEQHLGVTGVPHAVVRPAFFYGRRCVLMNNIAWLLRHLPMVAVGDGGGYRVRGMHVEDLARLCADLGERDDDVVVDGVGPDRPTFRELVEQIRDAVAPGRPVVDLPGRLFEPLTGVLGAVLRDRLITRDEYRAMAAGLADSGAPATGSIRFGDWLSGEAATLGRRYLNDTRS